MNKRDLVRTSRNLVDYSESEELHDEYLELQDSVSELSAISNISKKKRKSDKPFEDSYYKSENIPVS